MDYTRPAAQSALQALSKRKQEHLQLPSPPIIQAWDRDFYCPPEPPAPPIPLPPLTLGTVFMALSRLFQHLYGISFRPVESAKGEIWHSGVRKLEVIDQEKGIIGWIYADLLARRGKASGAAHYTVRCSRRTDYDEDDTIEMTQDEAFAVRESIEFEAVKRHRLPGQPGVYQLPVVVLLCEFGRSTLEWHEVMTLFHEMGHAMHCKLPRSVRRFTLTLLQQ
jgi:mitochondrial intermediate peptidase